MDARRRPIAFPARKCNKRHEKGVDRDMLFSSPSSFHPHQEIKKKKNTPPMYKCREDMYRFATKKTPPLQLPKQHPHPSRISTFTSSPSSPS